jgi:hypothetical protein
MIFEIFSPKKSAKKLSKIAENCDHNIDPWLGGIAPSSGTEDSQGFLGH